jgi:hypothetical protein
MSGMVTLTLTGAKRYMIAGTTHTVEKWQQCKVDTRTAQHLLDQYFVDKNNQEQPYFEEGVIEKPVPRADRKRVRASQRRLDREAARQDDPNQAFRQDAAPAQDPYSRNQDNAPDWAVNKNVEIGPGPADEGERAGPVMEAAEPQPEVKMEVAAKAPVKRKRAASKKTGKRAAKKAA